MAPAYLLPMVNPMNVLCKIATLIAIAFACASCGRSTDNGSAFSQISVLGSKGIAIHSLGAPDATVTADGSLKIDGRPVALSPPQQALLKTYVTGATALRNDAIATGAAGVATARQAIGSVVAGLANGTPDKIGPAVEAQAAKVDAQAAKVCADLAALRATQDALATDLIAFRPYATIAAGEVAKCGPDAR